MNGGTRMVLIGFFIGRAFFMLRGAGGFSMMVMDDYGVGTQAKTRYPQNKNRNIFEQSAHQRKYN